MELVIEAVAEIGMETGKEFTGFRWRYLDAFFGFQGSQFAKHFNKHK